jgi:transposase
MVNLEERMERQTVYQQGMRQSEIARQLGLDRKIVRKYLHGPPQSYGPGARWPWKLESSGDLCVNTGPLGVCVTTNVDRFV